MQGQLLHFGSKWSQEAESQYQSSEFCICLSTVWTGYIIMFHWMQTDSDSLLQLYLYFRKDNLQLLVYFFYLD